MPDSVIIAPPGSRLEQLLAAYSALKAAAEEADAQYKACRDAIKAEVTASGVSSDYEVRATPGFPSLQVSWRTRWHLDTEKMKAEAPETYARYAVQAGRWELRELKP